jgi:hypothetical protein
MASRQRFATPLDFLATSEYLVSNVEFNRIITIADNKLLMSQGFMINKTVL